MYTSKFYSEAGTSQNCGTFEYLMSFARRLLDNDSGMVEIRDAHGTLKASIWTEAGEVNVWIA